MGIWIRSQDKRALTKCEDIQISGTEIINFTRYGVVELGKYSAKEKALKVLDMIEKKIIENNTIVCNEKGWAKYVGIRNCVFQMPQDDKVEENA